MYKMIVLILCVLCAACGSEEAAPPFAVVYDNSWTPTGGVAVYESFQDWNKQLGEEVFYSGSADSHGDCNVVYVQFVDVIEVGRTSVGRYTPVGCNFVLKLAPAALIDTSTIKHELGHVLGLEDSDEPESVMFWTAPRWPTVITELNVEEVRAKWGF